MRVKTHFFTVSVLVKHMFFSSDHIVKGSSEVVQKKLGLHLVQKAVMLSSISIAVFGSMIRVKNHFFTVSVLVKHMFFFI